MTADKTSTALDENVNSFREVELTCDCNAKQCPCCTRQPKDCRQTVGDTNIVSRYDSLLDDSDSECSEDLDDEDHMMPGLLKQGMSYTVKGVLVQGWIHKKGTGLDLFASRAWKARWAVLLARVPGHQADVPMLQIYWNESAPSPSTVILLNSAVIVPSTGPDPGKWNYHRFEIQHVKKPLDESQHQVTRIFSCPKQGRDRWVYAMNQALLDYEKEKAARKSMISSPLKPLSIPANESYPKSQKTKHRLSIPLSPPLSSRRPVPLPKPPLAGVDLLDQEQRHF
eukprot:scaffold22634_cov123-Cylindrotheca_fusiformis.AAC.8